MKGVIFASSTIVAFGATKKAQLTTDTVHVFNPYGATKAFGENLGRWFHDTYGIDFLAARIGYFRGVRFFRLVPGFVTQFGVHGDPAVNAVWDTATIADDPRRTGNALGTVAFAANGPDSRAVQLFISTGDNRQKLDRQGFAPIGRVVDGMSVVTALNAEYGEEPNAVRAVRQGNRYLSRWFPALDSIVTTNILPDRATK